MPELATRIENERRLKAAIILLFKDDPEAYLKAGFESKLRDALSKELGATYLEAYLQLADEIAYDVSLSSAVGHAEKWAESYSRRLAAELTASMRDRWSGRDEDFDLEQVIDAAVLMIVITEITRAITKGERDFAKRVNRSKRGRLEGFWTSERDRKVCPLCQKCDGQPEKYWRRYAPNGSPAHPGCRCFITWVYTPLEGD